MDNEIRTPSGEDALTVPEILDAVRGQIWKGSDSDGPYTNREPFVGQFERNLQLEHVSRMIDLATGMRWPGASGKTIQSLARHELIKIQGIVDSYPALDDLDAYSVAHLVDVRERITRALEASYLRAD